MNNVVKQEGGTHYEHTTGRCPHCGGDVQHWDLYGEQPYLVGMITKYVTRYRLKSGLEDLRKARTALEKLIGLEEAKAKEQSKYAHTCDTMPFDGRT